jgi:hypothetical protein
MSSSERLTERQYLDFIMYFINPKIYNVPLFHWRDGEVYHTKIGVVATMEVKVEEIQRHTRMVEFKLTFHNYERMVNYYVNLNHSPREALGRFHGLLRATVWNAFLDDNLQDYVMELNEKEKRRRMDPFIDKIKGMFEEEE